MLPIYEEKAKVTQNLYVDTLIVALGIILPHIETIFSKLAEEKAYSQYVHILMALKLAKKLDEVWETLGDVMGFIRGLRNIPVMKGLQTKLHELEERVKAVEKAKIEISIRVQKDIEKELKEWFEERERMKKTLERYVA